MARLARAEVFSPDEVAVVHVMNRVVRRCFLLGTDPFTGRNYNYRKVWIEDLLEQQAALFGIDLLAFAIMGNHFHLILRSRPDVVAKWSNTEVVRRWLLLCPFRRDLKGNAEEPTSTEINSIRSDADKLAMIRLRLSDIAWWVRLFCQQVAQRANGEDREIGKFWQSRFNAVRLLDDAAILACTAYVDLNPIRAGIAKSLAASDHTSIQRRIQSASTKTGRAIGIKSASKKGTPSQTASSSGSSDQFLTPLLLNEGRGRTGPLPSQTPDRCSDKGFLPLTLQQYVEVLNWTTRQFPRMKRGWSIQDAPQVLALCPLDPNTWCHLVKDFGQMFCQVAGQVQSVDTTRSRLGQSRYHMTRKGRKLLTPDTP